MKLIAVASMIANLLIPSGVTTAELKGVMPSELRPYCSVFIQAEEEFGVNAIFLVSVCALESAWGTSEVSETYNNLYGWTDGEYVEFESKEDCIMVVANYLKRNYLSEDGKYYNGLSVADVNVKYNGREEWEKVVVDIMTGIHEDLEENRNGI